MLLCSNDFQNDLRRHYSEAWLQVLVYCYLASRVTEKSNFKYVHGSDIRIFKK